MRYAVVLLVALSGACKFDLPTGFNPFKFSGPQLTTATVSPTVVRAGSRFVASASAVFSNCSSPEGILTGYADQSVAQDGTTFSWSFTAVLGQEVVTFYPHCGTTGGPTLQVRIQVLPAQ